MQGLPRISMISLDLKESSEAPDFSPLYKYIESQYNENSENYKEAFKDFLHLRKTSVSGSENLNCLTSMKRYYSQLQLLKARFPLSTNESIAVTWFWEDSNTNTTVSLADIRFEEASILFNIGSLHCNLGAKESRVDLDSTKIACTHFQCSAWAFQTILDKYTPLSVADLECDLLRFLNLLMLAQAHECVLEKSMVDQRRAGITAKIAFQISDFYKQCQGLLRSENIGYAVNSRQYKNWKRTCILKEHLYFCLSYYYMGLMAEEANKYGDIVAWMKLAKEKLDKCLKSVKELKSSSADETIKFVQDVVNGKLESSVKDNNFVYYDKVPEPDMLPQIKGAMLLKGIGFDVNDPEIIGKDIFHSLIPMETHFSSSVYSEKKAEVLRSIQNDADEKNEEIKQFLMDMQWDNETLSLSDSKVPQELYSCAAFIAVNPDIFSTIKNMMQDISSISIEVEESLEVLSNRMRTIKNVKALDSWKSIEQEYSEFISNFEDAKESNDQLREAFACTLGDFTLVQQPMSTVIDSLPSVTEISENADIKKLIEESCRLLGKVEEMTSQRSDLLVQLKTQMMEDDLTQQLLSSNNDSERNRIIEEGLKKHSELIDYLRQNMSAQARIMDAIVEHNAHIAGFKMQILEIKQEREKVISRIIRSFNLYKDIIKKGEEGIAFYRKLSDRITKLQKDVDRFIPAKPKPLESEVNPLPQPCDIIEKQIDFTATPSQIKSEQDYINYYAPTLSGSINKPLRLKDYLNDRKKFQHSKTLETQETPQISNTSQNQMSSPLYQYTPWGFYGPPSAQATHVPNYSTSKCKTKDCDFRTTQNVYLSTPASEVGIDNSVYLNYLSLPRTNYSSFSSSFNTPMSSAASIGNLATNSEFTIPYQHNSFDNPNIISMAHGFGHASVPPNKPISNEYERQQYCSYPYAHEINDSQYPQNQNPYSDPSFANIRYQYMPFSSISQPIQPSTQFPTSNSIQSPASISQHDLASYSYPDYHQFTPSAIQNNQYSNFQTIPQQQNNAHLTDFYSNANSSNYPVNQHSQPISSNNIGNIQNTYENQENIIKPKVQDIPRSQNQDIIQPMPMANQPIVDKFPNSHHISNQNKNTTNTNTNNSPLSNPVERKLNSTDLLSSSPTNACKQDKSFAVLEPKILTKQELEDQKEEKRKQIYHKQHSGSKQPFNDHLILNKFIADAERFLKKINDFLDSNNCVIFDQHWNQLISKERNITKKSTAIAKCSPMKNRMQDSVPYDENRVVIKDGKDDYINASHILLQNIDDCFPRFITCQSPLSNTISEFWTAIFEQGCEILVQLASPSRTDDTSKARVVTYWPDPKSKSLSVGSKFEISVQSFKEKPNWDERILLMKHLKTNQSRSVWHFLVHNVSNKLPKSLDEFLSFETELCRYYRQQRSLTKPIAVSCMNGSSVSGLFILLTSAILQMEITGIFPDIDNILLSMWQQRRNLLDDKHQLLYVYKAVSKASSDLLSKRNIVIGPGRISANIHSVASEHSSHSSMIGSPINPQIPVNSSTSIIDSIFTNQHLQISDLDSVLSKWTLKPEETQKTPENAKPNILTQMIPNNPSNNKANTEISIIPSSSSSNKVATTRNIKLPSTLIHLQDPSSIDFTPTPVEKRKMTKKEFEAKLNNTYVEMNSNVDSFDPLRKLDPIQQLH